MSSLEQHKEAIAKLRRAFWARCFSIADQQRAAQKDPGASGSIWVSRTSLGPPPEQDARSAFLRVVDELRQGEEVYGCPFMQDLPVQWVGRRNGVGSRTPEPDLSERVKYDSLMRETFKEGPTILYFHGGGFYLGSPVMARSATAALSSLSGGRCLSVAYRYSTTEPFPGALMDAFQAYLSLLSPPYGSFHTAVPCSKIVLAGESCGLNLALALVQMLVRLRESVEQVKFHGCDVRIELPAGVAGISGWLDPTFALPSWKFQGEFDYMPYYFPCYTDEWPGDPTWPAEPPRGDLYCQTSTLAHPLVCPIAARSWKNAPPIWMACGEERCADGSKLVAQQAARDGVAVLFEEYEAMPHAWTIYLPKSPHGRRTYEEWAQVCKRMVRQDKFYTSGRRIAFHDLGATELDVTNLIDLSQEEAMAAINLERNRRPTFSRSQLKVTGKPSL